MPAARRVRRARRTRVSNNYGRCPELALAAARARELRRRAGEARGEDLDELDRRVRVLADDLHEELLRDLQRLELGQRLGGGGARHFADDRDLAEEIVLAHVVEDR